MRQLRRSASSVAANYRAKVAALLQESNELVAIFVASRKNTEARIAREAAQKSSK